MNRLLVQVTQLVTTFLTERLKKSTQSRLTGHRFNPQHLGQCRIILQPGYPRKLVSPAYYPTYITKCHIARIIGVGTAGVMGQHLTKLFPEAPLIHVIRHPLDIMVSSMSNHFTHGLFCSSALETAARHYVRVVDLVQKYRSEMALRYLPVRYEDMVSDQEATIRSVLDFIGEDFDPSCLQFHENRRYARTASYAQVTEKLYDGSRYRYRNYRRELEPAAEILEPLIRRLGYAID